MKIIESTDIPIIHSLMIQAFMEYKNDDSPSSALEETEHMIQVDQDNGGRALVCYFQNEPVGMVRFKHKEEGLYFYRLSVIPQKQSQGIAKALIQALEKVAFSNNVGKLMCKVRMDVSRNIRLYHAMDFQIVGEEVIHRSNTIKIPVIHMEKQLYSV